MRRNWKEESRYHNKKEHSQATIEKKLNTVFFYIIYVWFIQGKTDFIHVVKCGVKSNNDKTKASYTTRVLRAWSQN